MSGTSHSGPTRFYEPRPAPTGHRLLRCSNEAATIVYDGWFRGQLGQTTANRWAEVPFYYDLHDGPSDPAHGHRYLMALRLGSAKLPLSLHTTWLGELRSLLAGHNVPLASLVWQAGATYNTISSASSYWRTTRISRLTIREDGVLYASTSYSRIVLGGPNRPPQVGKSMLLGHITRLHDARQDVFAELLGHGLNGKSAWCPHTPRPAKVFVEYP
jgi:hypothetical protein